MSHRLALHPHDHQQRQRTSPRTKEEAGETSRYFGPLLEHSSVAGLIKYYYAGSLLVAQRSTAGVVWHHQDHLGSTWLLTDQNGKVVQRYQYGPFGQILGATGTHDNDIAYTGHRSDMSTGLIYCPIM